MAKNKNKLVTETAKHASSDEPALPGEKARATMTVFLFIHLFIVFVCLAANLAPSTLQRRMLRFFQPYAQLLNFDLDGTRYYITQAAPQDDDYRIEVVPKDATDRGDQSWVPVARGARGSERYHRYQRLADTMAFFQLQENEETTALIAEAVSRCYLLQDGTPLQQIRCRQHMPQSREDVDNPSSARRDPNDAYYLSTLYRANVIVGAHNRIRILKRAAAALEAAPDRRAKNQPRSLRGPDRRAAPGGKRTPRSMP